MVPKFKEDDYYGAISGACSKIIALARGEGFPPAEDDDVSWWEVILTLGLIGALFYWYSKKIKSKSLTLIIAEAWKRKRSTPLAKKIVRS